MLSPKTLVVRARAGNHSQDPAPEARRSLAGHAEFLLWCASEPAACSQRARKLVRPRRARRALHCPLHSQILMSTGCKRGRMKNLLNGRWSRDRQVGAPQKG